MLLNQGTCTVHVHVAVCQSVTDCSSADAMQEDVRKSGEQDVRVVWEVVWVSDGGRVWACWAQDVSAMWEVVAVVHNSGRGRDVGHAARWAALPTSLGE